MATNFAYKVALFILIVIYHYVKFYDSGLPALLPPPPPKEVVQQIFVALKNPSSWAGFKSANLGSNGKHANHSTTEGDWEML
jgi:hypothetical protein